MNTNTNSEKAENKNQNRMKWCPECDNYLYHNLGGENNNSLFRRCMNCGYTEEDEDGGLVVETRVQERASEGYKILLNEFTAKDPTLPHVKNVKCPNEACESNKDTSKRDVIYIKYDAVNLKYIYICTVCDTRWRSR